MELPAFLLLLVTFAIIFATIMYVVYIKTHDETRQNMNDLANHYSKTNASNTPTSKMPYCPTGCARGDCKDAYRCDNFIPPNVHCCKFDIQCRNCVDKKTGQVYYNEGGDTKYIDENYNTTDPNTINQLNQEIQRQNEYIEDVNQLVSDHNKPFFEQEQTEKY